MPIPFTCPHCRTQFYVPYRDGGRTGSCGMCGKMIVIPSRAPGYEPAPTSCVVVAVLTVMGIVLLLCCGGPLAYFYPQLEAARDAAEDSRE